MGGVDNNSLKNIIGKTIRKIIIILVSFDKSI